MNAKTNPASDSRMHAAETLTRPMPAHGLPAMPVVDSRQLFGQLQEIGIMHEGSLYRLKITRQGKLILNK